MKNHWPSSLKKLFFVGLALGYSVAIQGAAKGNQPETIALTVATEQWLEIEETTGLVLYETAQGTGQAVLGTRLQAVGDRIQTQANATATLAVDTNIGSVTLSENTTLQIRSLSVSPRGGRITQLQILEGQARLQVRTFNNPDSALEIETPAGWSGVRGTEFGIAVGPNGSTSLATREGSVETCAQAECIIINAGLQTQMLPGEPPSPATALTNNPGLDIRKLFVTGNTLHISGQVEPTHLLMIDDTLQVLTTEGGFSSHIPRPTSSDRITAVVMTPLGARQVYELAHP